MRVFIFGIGGTGSKVLRSLAMLLASGVKFDNPNIEVIPVIIDMDAYNGSTTRTRDIFRNAAADGFFNTKIRSFNHLDAESADLDLQFDFQNREGSFADFIHYNGLNKLNQEVLELMYNDSADDADFPELYLNLNVGFKGNPNIGSVVFNNLENSQEFKNLEANYHENDRIFIISSIFGGTGSAGFPTLVKLIRNSENMHLRKTILGAITVMPYFSVKPEPTSAINSSLFTTKTKAALSYYAEDDYMKSINALYYIADKQPGMLPNIEGGKDQVFDAHIVELISAISIVDFIAKNNDELTLNYSNEGQCYSFGAESDGRPFNLSHFDPITKDRWIKPLVKFAYAAQIATRFVPQLKDARFYKQTELKIESSMDIPNEYAKMLSFFESFKKWSAEEMPNEINGRIFNSFSYIDKDHLNNLVTEKPVKTGFLKSGLTKEKIGEILTKRLDNEPKDKPIAQKYFNILYETATECLTSLGQLP
jgi:hypothetical protein